MAREIHERENLLRDAKAFDRRLQLQWPCPEKSVEVFVGFRSCDAVSFYFDGDPVYHFNSDRELRRAFIDGQLLKAERGQLIRWDPQRSASAIAMQRKQLTPELANSLEQAMFVRLAALHDAIDKKRIDIDGSVPSGQATEILHDLTEWLESVDELRIAKSPRVG